MKKIKDFFAKPYRYAACFSAVLVLFTVYALLDAFVIPKTIAIVDSGSGTKNQPDISDSLDSDDKVEAVITDMSYYDGKIDLKIEKVDENGNVFYVAELKLTDPSDIKTAFPGGVFGKNISEKTSVMAEENDALFAINGDYCGFRDTGVIMRNGIILREKPRSNRYGLLIDSNGDFIIMAEKEITQEKLTELDIVQCFSFGPTLVVDGEINICETGTSKSKNPRTAIGQIEPLHYLFIVVDGRSAESNGMEFSELAEEMKKRGCVTAYNLDGGGSATMWFNGNVINSPTDGKKEGEREISDIIYIGRNG